MQKAGCRDPRGYLARPGRGDAGQEGRQIGFSGLIKAVAGGGGKGMRRVD